jgi:hypothetical protein
MLPIGLTSAGGPWELQKKNQKTFIRWVLRRTDRCANSDMDKSFLVLFFKKELLSCATLFL